MQPSPSPLRGLRNAAPFAALFWLFWKAFIILTVLACGLVLAARLWDYTRAARWPRRLLAALVLLFYKPRHSVEPELYDFCYPGHA